MMSADRLHYSYSTRYDTIFFVDSSEVLASLASKATNHQDFLCVLAFNAEWAGSGVLEVPTDIFVEIIFGIFHTRSNGYKLIFSYALLSIP